MRLTLIALQLAHLVSLDVFCIAFAWCSLVLCEISGKTFEIWQPLVISCSVWIAYTIDRINDGRRLDRSRPHWSRHLIHYRYQKLMRACLALVVLAVSVVILVRANFSQVSYGLCLTVLVVLYFWLHGRGCKDAAEPLRPVAVGSLFSCGVCLPTFVDAGSEVKTVLVMLCLVSLFTFNTISVARLERGIDQMQSGRECGTQRFWRRIVLLATVVLHLISLVLVIGSNELSSVFRWGYLGAALLLALNCVAFGGLKPEPRSSKHDTSFMTQLIGAGDSTHAEHVGSCFAEAALWVPAVIALCWGG